MDAFLDVTDRGYAPGRSGWTYHLKQPVCITRAGKAACVVFLNRLLTGTFPIPLSCLPATASRSSSRTGAFDLSLSGRHGFASQPSALFANSVSRVPASHPPRTALMFPGGLSALQTDACPGYHLAHISFDILWAFRGVSGGGSTQFLGAVAHSAFPGTSRARDRSCCFDNVNEHLSFIGFRYSSRMLSAYARLQTAKTRPGWIRGALWPCLDLNLGG